MNPATRCRNFQRNRIYADRIAGSKVDHKTKDTFQYHATCYGVGDYQCQGHAQQWTGTYEYRNHETFRADSMSLQINPIVLNSITKQEPRPNRGFRYERRRNNDESTFPLLDLQIPFVPYLCYRTLLPLQGVGDDVLARRWSF